MKFKVKAGAYWQVTKVIAENASEAAKIGAQILACHINEITSVEKQFEKIFKVPRIK